MRWLANPWVQAAMVLTSAITAYVGGVVAADVFNANCAPLAGQSKTWARPMDPVATGFPIRDVFQGTLLLFPPLLLARGTVSRCTVGLALAAISLNSLTFLYNSPQPKFCVNSGGMTDDYDAPGILLILVFALLVIITYGALLTDLISRLLRRKPSMPSK